MNGTRIDKQEIARLIIGGGCLLSYLLYREIVEALTTSYMQELKEAET